MVEGLLAIKTSNGICKGCIVGKHPEHKFDWGKESVEKCNLGLVNFDIRNPMPTTSTSSSQYVLTFIDDFYRYTWVFLLKKKSEVLERFIEFKALVENSSRRNIKSLIYDNGGEYIKSEFLQICFDIGIQSDNPFPTHPNKMV